MKKLRPILILLAIASAIALVVIAVVGDDSSENPQNPRNQRSVAHTPAANQPAAASNESQPAANTPAASTSDVNTPGAAPAAAVATTETTLDVPERPAGLTDADCQALLDQHRVLFGSGVLDELQGTEARLRDYQPVASFPSFVVALMADSDFERRLRLLALLDQRSADSLWQLFQRMQSSYERPANYANWRAGEVALLRELLVRVTPTAVTRPQGISALRTTIGGGIGRSFRPDLLHALSQLSRDDAYADALLAFCREQLDQSGFTRDELRDLAITLLRQQPDSVGVGSVINDTRLTALRPLLLAEAMGLKLIERAEALGLAEACLVSLKGEGLPGLLAAMAELDLTSALNLARSLPARQGIETDLSSACMALVAKHGTPVEQEALANRAMGNGGDARRALRALIDAQLTTHLANIYEQTQSMAVKAQILPHLVQGEERQIWLNRSLAADQPAPLRQAAVASLRPEDSADQQRLRDLASSDPDPAVRLRALQALVPLLSSTTLSTAERESMQRLFQERSGAESDATVKAYARDISERQNSGG